MSTINHVTPEYPPVFLTVGDVDPLAPHSADLIDVLVQNGVEVDSVLFEGTNPELGHEYQFDFTSPHAEKTLGRTFEFLKSIADAPVTALRFPSKVCLFPRI